MLSNALLPVQLRAPTPPAPAPRMPDGDDARGFARMLDAQAAQRDDPANPTSEAGRAAARNRAGQRARDLAVPSHSAGAAPAALPRAPGSAPAASAVGSAAQANPDDDAGRATRGAATDAARDAQPRRAGGARGAGNAHLDATVSADGSAPASTADPAADTDTAVDGDNASADAATVRQHGSPLPLPAAAADPASVAAALLAGAAAAARSAHVGADDAGHDASATRGARQPAGAATATVSARAATAAASAATAEPPGASHNDATSATPPGSFGAILQNALAPTGGPSAADAVVQQTLPPSIEARPDGAARGSISARPGSAEFAPQLGAQLSTFIRDGVQHARLELQPPEMGPVTVQIRLDGNAAQVHLAAANAQTRAALEQALPQLATTLRDAGLTLSGGGVFDQPRQAASGNEGDGGRAPSRDGTESRELRTLRGGGAPGDGPALPPLFARRRGVVDLVA